MGSGKATLSEEMLLWWWFCGVITPEWHFFLGDPIVCLEDFVILLIASPFMSPLVQILEKVLAESYAVFLKTQNYHWNLTSKHAFYALHKLLEEQYQELGVGIDDLAEKIRQLGAFAPASFAAYQELSTIGGGDPSYEASAMLRDLADDQGKLIVRLNEAIKVAHDVGDEGAEDLLVERLRVHDKSKWMLESSL